MLANFVYKRPDGKCMRFCQPRGLCCNRSRLGRPAGSRPPGPPGGSCQPLIEDFSKCLWMRGRQPGQEGRRTALSGEVGLTWSRRHGQIDLDSAWQEKGSLTSDDCYKQQSVSDIRGKCWEGISAGEEFAFRMRGREMKAERRWELWANPVA